MPQRPPRRLLRALLTVAIVLAVGTFFARSLMSNIDAVRAIDFSIDGWIIGAVITFALAVLVSGALWGRMVTLLSGVRIPTSEAIRVHSSSWLLKYIPGQVGSIVNKVAWAQKRGLSKTLITLTFIYENVFLIVSSLVPTTVILLLAGNVDLTGNAMLLAALLALIPLLIMTSRPVFSWMSSLLTRRALKREMPSEYFLSSRQSLTYQLWYLIPRVVNGVGVAALAHSMIDPPPSAYLPIACAYIIAGAVGILAIAVPSGIGVRESVFVFLALPYIGVEAAIVMSLAARLWATAADLVVAAVYFVLTAIDRHRVGSAPDAGTVGERTDEIRNHRSDHLGKQRGRLDAGGDDPTARPT